jgi:hypothetical protein
MFQIIVGILFEKQTALEFFKISGRMTSYIKAAGFVGSIKGNLDVI